MEPEPYPDSATHVLDELRRLDLLIRVHLERWWAQNEGTVDEFRGLYVSDETVDGLLHSSDAEANRGGGGVVGDRELLDEIERAEHEIRARERRTISNGGELRLVRLADRFGLDPRDRDALLLALAPEFDRKYETIYSYLQDDVTRTRPTVDLVLRVLCHSERERLEARRLFARESRLIRNRLVGLSPADGTPRPSRVLVADERVVEFLGGGDDLADEVGMFAEVLTPEGMADGTVTLLGRDPLARRSGTGERNREGGIEGRDAALPSMTYLHGPYGSGKGATVTAACLAEGTPVLKADARAMLEWDLPEGLRLLVREARLQDAALYVSDLTSALGAKDGAEPEAFVSGLDAFDGPVYLSGEQPLPSRLHLRVTRHEFETVALPVPPYERRKALWERVDGLPDGAEAADLAAKFRFTPGQIADAIETAKGLAGEELTAEDLYEGCRAQSNETLRSLARQVDPTYTWEDIVLPPDRLGHLREVAARIRHQGTVYSEWGFAGKFTLGNGLNVLFTGPSGTGKTMAAEVVARDAGLDLYKIDLSSVVSKYIGETEKNLRRIFDEAEETDAILFFDEADALFGKRSEVKDAHDRYANIEVNYLLQRVEEHDGTVILTTNFKQNIDEAFLRRIHLSVDFPRPDAESREAIWQLVFPEETPVEELDFEFLSTLEVTGGNIRNVALTAAFMAAEEDRSVGMEHVVRAVRREFQKTGKLIRPEEFGRYRTMLTS